MPAIGKRVCKTLEWTKCDQGQSAGINLTLCIIHVQTSEMVQQLLADAAAHVSYDQLHAGVRRITGYEHISKKTIDPVRLLRVP